MFCFLHMIIMNRDNRLAMCPGHTVIVGPNKAERLSKTTLDLAVR